MALEDMPRGVQSASWDLQYGATTLDDESVWQAVLGALDEVDLTDEGELWGLGDTFFAESVLTRPELEQRLLELRIDSKPLTALFRVMADPAWNWDSALAWSDPEWLRRGREGRKERAASEKKERRRPKSTGAP